MNRAFSAGALVLHETRGVAPRLMMNAAPLALETACSPLVPQVHLGIAQVCPLDALRRVRDQRLKGFHEDEPAMNAGGIFRWFVFVSLQIVP
jgi:hypothetical protein